MQRIIKDVDGDIYSEHLPTPSQILYRWRSTQICNRQQNNRFLTLKKQNLAFLKNYGAVREVFHAYSMTF